MKQIRNYLSSKLDKQEMDDVEKLFQGHLNESGLEEGISRPEFEQVMTWLKDNKSKHQLEDDDLEFLEKSFAEHLKD